MDRFRIFPSSRLPRVASAAVLVLVFALVYLPGAASAWDMTGTSRPGSDFNGDGKDDLVWYHGEGTGVAHVLTSNGSSLRYSGQWRTGLAIPDWSGIGDFNGDGKDDLAWYHAAGSAEGTVSVLPSNGSSFGFAGRWVSGLGRPTWVGVGDFNGDGKDDLAWYHATGSAAQTVSVLLSNGVTGFTYVGRWATGLGSPDWAGVGDYNGDGKDDLAWYHASGSAAQTVSVLLSNGTSGFAYSGRWISGLSLPDWVGTGDFNGDRRDDLAWYHADGSAAGTVSSLISNGTSGFAYTGRWATGLQRPEWAGVGDYTGDGKDDLSWYRPGTATTGSADVMRSTGSAFGAATPWAGGLGRPRWAGNGARPIQATGPGADLDGNGADDLFWYHKGSQQISAVLSDGSSSFSLVNVWRSGMGNPDWAGAGDFNRDGKDDVAWYHKESQQINVALSDGSTFLIVAPWRSGMGNPDWAGVGDFDGNGKDDIAWYHKEGDQAISVALSDGTSFSSVTRWRTGMGNPDWAGVGDFDRNGRDDLAWYHSGGQEISTALSDGSTFLIVAPWRSGMGNPDWAGPGDISRRYPTSWQYGAANHLADTDAEVAAVRAAIEAAPTSDQEALISGLSPADLQRVYPTSWQYGGTDRSISTEEEWLSYGDMAVSQDQATRNALQTGMRPRDRAQVQDASAVCRAVVGNDPQAYQDICLMDQIGEDDPDSYPRSSPTDEISPAEVAVCVSYGKDICERWYGDRDEAIAMTERLWTGLAGRSDSTIANAFQHALWNALMAKSVQSGSDERRRKAVLTMSTAHEKGAYNRSDNEGRKSRMDMVNNAIGAEWGIAFRSESERSICARLLNEVWSAGRKIPVDSDPFQFTNGHPIWRTLYEKSGGTALTKVTLTGLDCTI